ncbi:hypothetical protein CAPTEDRAFT_217544 [Capitella teleta]|uniref:non-specific serine/threonine protein kinase n=1 Tax=Capitella teleta TaxID=283909 RepID=R7TC90_CAPTE|nr:hypothetical protein CAPTEDRAFT_217544 [Capitella teleta]|eukprot:ELT91299.1 hypothetical protein CAPTEDRAFT_217544 [Capitella teleta]
MQLSQEASRSSWQPKAAGTTTDGLFVAGHDEATDAGVYYRVPYLDMIVKTKGKDGRHRGCELCRKRIHSKNSKPHLHDVTNDTGLATSQFGSNATSHGRGIYAGFHPNKPLRQTYPRPGQNSFNLRGAGTSSYWRQANQENIPMKPKVITVVRNSGKPRTSVKILLNRRSVQSYEQLMKDITEAFGPKWKNNKMRKLFTVRGREVKGISDFFREDDVFIGIGNEQLSSGHVAEILEELYPDSLYAKNLLRDWTKKKNKKKVSDAEQTKIDSGLGSDDTQHREDEETPKRTTKQDEDLASRLERERARAAESERERARRRMQKRLEAERRALDEERRKRGLLPLKAIGDPFKKMQEERDKEKVEEEKRKEAADQEQSKRKKEEKKREVEKQFKKEEQPKVIVVVKDEVLPDSGRTSKAKKTDDAERASKMNKVTEKKVNKAHDQIAAKKISKTPVVKDNKQTEKDEGKEDDKEEKKKKAKNKAIVKKTKLERQVSSVQHVMDRYDVSKTLGDGNFAIVKQCQLKETKADYAMKIIDKAKLKGKEQMIENEIEIMKKCNQANIVRLIEEFETKDDIYLIMELVKGGDLFDAITQSVKFPEVKSSSMVRDLANALHYLHSREIVHRDLKPENLMVCHNKDGSMSLKLADFGLAMEVKQDIFTVCGTPTYVAPEILSETGYGLEVDMWALGVISYILLCGFPPFRSPDRNQTELFEFIKAGEYEFLSPYWDKISRSAKDLISRLLVVDRKKRFTAIDTLSHAWIITNGGSLPAPSNLEQHQLTLRRELKDEAKVNLQNYKQGRMS